MLQYVEDDLLFLQKELLSKDDIIKSLVEMQTAILDSKSNTASEKQIPTPLSVSPNLREKQQRKHQVQHSTQQQIENQQEQPMQQTLHLKRTQKYNMKKIYVGNLNKDVTINDLNELFGLKTTRYLQEYCSIELPVNEKTGKSRGFAFISCPDHVCNELIGINFLESCIIVEEATSTRSRVNQGATNSVTRRPQVVVNQFPENQDVYFKPSVIPGNRSYTETVQSLRKVIIFGDSIPRGIRIHEFNSLVKKGYAKMKSFPGATSKELLHYVDPTLKDGIYNTAIIHVGVNDLLNNKSTNKVDELVKNLESTAIKCISNGITKVVVSGIAINNKMSDSFIGDVNKKIAMMC